MSAASSVTSYPALVWMELTGAWTFCSPTILGAAPLETSLTRRALTTLLAVPGRPGWASRRVSPLLESTLLNLTFSRGDAFRPLAVETYGCLDGSFDNFLRECVRRAAASGTTLASSSTLACFFRQRVFVALQRAQAIAVCRRTMALNVAHAGLPSLLPRDPLHCRNTAHIAAFRGAGCA